VRHRQEGIDTGMSANLHRRDIRNRATTYWPRGRSHDILASSGELPPPGTTENARQDPFLIPDNGSPSFE
jgi:hypothetical protein